MAEPVYILPGERWYKAINRQHPDLGVMARQQLKWKNDWTPDRKVREAQAMGFRARIDPEGILVLKKGNGPWYREEEKSWIPSSIGEFAQDVSDVGSDIFARGAAAATGAGGALTLGAPLIAASGPFAPITAGALGLVGGIGGAVGGEALMQGASALVNPVKPTGREFGQALAGEAAATALGAGIVGAGRLGLRGAKRLLGKKAIEPTVEAGIPREGPVMDADFNQIIDKRIGDPRIGLGRQLPAPQGTPGDLPRQFLGGQGGIFEQKLATPIGPIPGQRQLTQGEEIADPARVFHVDPEGRAYAPNPQEMRLRPGPEGTGPLAPREYARPGAPTIGQPPPLDPSRQLSYGEPIEDPTRVFRGWPGGDLYAPNPQELRLRPGPEGPLPARRAPPPPLGVESAAKSPPPLGKKGGRRKKSELLTPISEIPGSGTAPAREQALRDYLLRGVKAKAKATIPEAKATIPGAKTTIPGAKATVSPGPEDVLHDPFTAQERRYKAKVGAKPTIESTPVEAWVRQTMKEAGPDTPIYFSHVPRLEKKDAAGNLIPERESVNDWYRRRPDVMSKSEMKELLESGAYKKFTPRLIARTLKNWRISPERVQGMDLREAIETAIAEGKPPVTGKGRKFDPEDYGLRQLYSDAKSGFRTPTLDQLESMTWVDKETGHYITRRFPGRTRHQVKGEYTAGKIPDVDEAARAGARPAPFREASIAGERGQALRESQSAFPEEVDIRMGPPPGVTAPEDLSDDLAQVREALFAWRRSKAKTGSDRPSDKFGANLSEGKSFPGEELGQGRTKSAGIRPGGIPPEAPRSASGRPIVEPDEVIPPPKYTPPPGKEKPPYVRVLPKEGAEAGAGAGRRSAVLDAIEDFFRDPRISGPAKYVGRSLGGRLGRKLGSAAGGAVLGGSLGGLPGSIIGGAAGYLGARSLEGLAPRILAGLQAGKFTGALSRKISQLKRLTPGSRGWRAAFYLLLKDPEFRSWLSSQ